MSPSKKNLLTGLHCSSVIKFQSQVVCLDFLPSSVLLLPRPSDYNEDRGVCFSLETRTTVGNREFRGGKNSKKTDRGELLSPQFQLPLSLPDSAARCFLSKCARKWPKCAKKCASLKCQKFYCIFGRFRGGTKIDLQKYFLKLLKFNIFM